MNLIKMTLNTIENEKLRTYKFRYILGILGMAEGIVRYCLNRRWDTNLNAYVNYFIVRKITNEDM